MGWKIYSWILTACLAFAYYDIFSKTAKIQDLLDIPISLVALVGLFGYAYKKKIGNRQFWKFWLLLLIPWDILYNFFLANYPDVPKILVAIGIVLFLPEYIALYRYSSTRQMQWNQEQRSNQEDAPGQTPAR
jgi:hypothetical protein